MIELRLPYPVRRPVNFIDLIGQRFGSLIVQARESVADRLHRVWWRCRCDCGRESVVLAGNLRSGKTKSCGCLKKSARVTHRVRGTPTHNTWCAMKQRCGYTRARSFPHYGGRGITVCDRWRDSFEAFLADMGPRPPGMTLERIDNERGYEPGNCRWATEPEQARNRRSTIKVEIGGRTQCVKDWCDELGIDVDRVYGRIRRGIAPQEALRG